MSPNRLLLVSLAAVLCFAVGCGGDKQDQTAETDSAPAEDSAITLPGRVVVNGDPSLTGASLDSVGVRLGPGLTGRRVQGEPDTWAVDFNWFYLMETPVTLMTIAQMDSLANAGVVTDSTALGIAVYRIKVPGKTPSEAGLAAIIRQPARPPASLYLALKPQTINLTIP